MDNQEIIKCSFQAHPKVISWNGLKQMITAEVLTGNNIL